MNIHTPINVLAAALLSVQTLPIFKITPPMRISNSDVFKPFKTLVINV